jgi:NADPH:quinone reductase-like Zn-dependent oxidoreductase
MKAVRLHTPGDTGSLVYEDAAQPRPADGELLIRVHAVGVTASELAWYPTAHTKTGADRALPVPGHEFSGVVEATGEAAYGMNDWFADGAMAEYCISRPEYVAPKPRTLDHVRAAAVPIAALTAWQGLFDRARLERGQRLLIHGGAGGVGTFAVQLGHWCGAHVIATASAEHVEFLRGLGADQVLDYRAGRFADMVRDIDVVFDAVGGETLARSWSILKPGGRLVTIATSSETVTDPRTKEAFFIVEPNRAQLVRVAELIDAGHLRPIVGAVLPLSQAAQAVRDTDSHHAHVGKTVLEVVSAGEAANRAGQSRA